MKKAMLMISVVCAAAAVSACASDGAGHRDQAPYASERTAGGQDSGQAERVFRAGQVK